MNLRRLLRRQLDRDEAVSPVIAVILMVAITVVLAATVYVWVSGFGTGGQGAAKTISLSSGSAISADNKTYVVAAGTPGMKWGDLDFTLDGNTLTYANLTGTAQADNRWCVWNPATSTCVNAEPTTETIDAGDTFYVQHDTLSGKTLRVLDSQANSVILTLVVG